MSSIDTAIEITENALQIQIKNQLDWNWRWSNFCGGSYYIWAAKEILDRLNTNKDVPPLITIEHFRETMEEYADKSKGTSGHYLFVCAEDIAQSIIDEMTT